VGFRILARAAATNAALLEQLMSHRLKPDVILLNQAELDDIPAYEAGEDAYAVEYIECM
jgi:hypothetical protein